MAINAYALKRLVARLTGRVEDLEALVLTGTGTPAGNVSAVQGTIYIRTDGAAGTTLYLKSSGGGTASTSGWTAVASA